MNEKNSNNEQCFIPNMPYLVINKNALSLHLETFSVPTKSSNMPMEDNKGMTRQVFILCLCLIETF